MAKFVKPVQTIKTIEQYKNERMIVFIDNALKNGIRQIMPTGMTREERINFILNIKVS